MACGVSRDGSKASNMLKAAREYGLIAKGYKRELDEASRTPPAGDRLLELQSFCSHRGFWKGQSLSERSGDRSRTVSDDDLDQSFTGVVLVFEKGPNFKKGGEKQTLRKALAKRLPGSRMALAYAALGHLGAGPAQPDHSRLFQNLRGRLSGRRKVNWLKPLLLAMTCGVVLKAVATYFQQQGLLRLEMKLALSTSSKFFWYVLRLPMEFFAQRFAGEIGSRVEINDRVAVLLSGELATSIANLLLIGFYAALMIQYDVALTLIGVGIAVVNLVALHYVSRRRRDDNRKLLQETGKLMGLSMAGLQIIETLKSTGGESDYFSRWAGYQAKVLNSEQELGAATQLLSVVPSFLTALNAAAILGIGGFRVIDGFLTMGMLIAFQSLMTGFIEPVNRMVDVGGKLQEAEGDLFRLDDVLHYPVDPQISASIDAFQPGQETEKLNGYLELRNITFGYSRLDPPLLEDFSLSLKPGERVALVGASGSGKSTVAKIVGGLYAPWSGEVLFDHKPRPSIPRSVLNSSIAMVDQDIFLFEGAIRENLTMWDTTTEETSVIQAAKDAFIHDDIVSRAGGYDQTLEEAGRNFSGGQRQRLEIARALAGDPSILVLDEATSSLDAYMEKIVDDNLRRRGCTCLIVAHRLSTVRDCDQILVLQSGKVVERGTHDEMIQADGHLRPAGSGKLIWLPRHSNSKNSVPFRAPLRIGPFPFNIRILSGSFRRASWTCFSFLQGMDFPSERDTPCCALKQDMQSSGSITLIMMSC